MTILTCSSHFREILHNEYPKLELKAGNNISQGYWRHFTFLLFGESYKGIYVGQKQIAKDYKLLHKLKRNNLVAIDYINMFKEDILDYTVHEYNCFKHRARRVDVQFPPHILQARNKFLFENRDDKHEVFIDTGKVFNSRAITKIRKDTLQEVNLLFPNPVHSICSKFIDYLNNIPPHNFSKILVNKSQAYEYLNRKYHNDTYVLTEEQRYLIGLYLHSIEERPQPIYTCSKSNNTVRLFEYYKGLQNVPSDIRHLLTPNWIEIDLQNSHLAIVAKLWDISVVKEYLANGKSIWESFLPYLGFSADDLSIKKVIKPLLYGCIYGMGIETLKESITLAIGSDKYELFISHPVIDAVLKARTKRIKEIRNRGGVITYLGEHIHVIKFKNEEDKWEDNLLTILSQEASEYEMLLLEPILDLAISSKDFHLTLYQFDGVSIYIRDKSKKDYILKRIKKAVDKRAKELDINTQVIIK